MNSLKYHLKVDEDEVHEEEIPENRNNLVFQIKGNVNLILPVASLVLVVNIYNSTEFPNWYQRYYTRNYKSQGSSEYEDIKSSDEKS